MGKCDRPRWGAGGADGTRSSNHRIDTPGADDPQVTVIANVYVNEADEKNRSPVVRVTGRRGIRYLVEKKTIVLHLKYTSRVVSISEKPGYY